LNQLTAPDTGRFTMRRGYFVIDWLGVILPQSRMSRDSDLRQNSWWSRRLYGEGEKVHRAELRHGARVEGEPEKG
jgi:hypothetical protein